VRTTRQPVTTARLAATVPAREAQLIALAVNLAEKQLRDGTASAQVISHYLKKSSPREELELERLAAENRLLVAKVDSLKAAVDGDQLAAKALAAMRAYSGQDAESEEYDEYA
jgi:hypothetical protein